jgi:hypothetical protein
MLLFRALAQAKLGPPTPDDTDGPSKKSLQTLVRRGSRVLLRGREVKVENACAAANL